MSATLAEPTERPPAEFLGKARAFRNRVAAEDETCISTIKALLGPVHQRLQRFPDRKLRPVMLAAVVQGWRYMDARNFRLDLTAKLDRTRAMLTERRVVAGQMRRSSDPNWQDVEDDVAVNAISLLVAGNEAKLHISTLCTFSLHALARRIQLGVDSDDAALLFDMDVVAKVDQARLGGGGFKVITTQNGGGWRGRVVRRRTEDGELVPMLSIRTWLSS